MGEAPAPTHAAIIRLGDQVFPLQENRTYSLGSAAINDLILHHASIRPIHARITWRAGVVTLEVLGDGEPARLIVQPGARLRVGAIPLTLEAAVLDPWRAGQRATGAPPLRAASEATFAQILAGELRRAPWFGLSLLAHAVLFLFLLWYFDRPGAGSAHRALLGISERQGDAPESPGEEKPPDATPESGPPETDLTTTDTEAAGELMPDPNAAPAEDLGDPFAPPSARTDPSGLFARIGGRQRGNRETGTDILELGNSALQAGGFKKTVGAMRRSGLEIVFVVDSTGSMGSVLQGAKDRISAMVDVLHALVPDARVGVITYRDHGGAESYLLRQVPLSRDAYRAINFVQTITAAGGGDREEAVADALKNAFKERWSTAARRVVVLVGDAPPHQASEAYALSAVRGFASDGRSYVHAIVTSSDDTRNLPSDTMASFTKIAKAGRGVCLGFEDEQRVLQQVLSLAFGQEYKRNLEEVYKVVAEQNRKVAPWALDLVRRGDRGALDKALRNDPVDAEVVKALARTRDLGTALYLIETLGRGSPQMTEAGRHAAAHALQQVLALPLPPLDAERGGTLGAADLAQLRDRARRTL